MSINPNIELPVGMPKWNNISSYVKQLMNRELEKFAYTFFGNEPFEVKKSFKNSSENYGSVSGNFINNPNKEVLGGVVLPLNPNITNIPLIGEHISVTEYNGQHYYIGIINRKNSPNENSIPGTSGTYESDTKYGETFERKDIRRVTVCEGEIVYEGRFGNSIKLGCNHHNNSPNIKIRAGQRTDWNVDAPVKEDINEDGSSIYLTTDETIRIDGQDISGKNIFVKSDGLHFIARAGNVNVKASKDVMIEGEEVFINAKKFSGTIKMGDPKAIFIPTINGQKLFELIVSLTKVLSGLPQLAAANPKALKDIAEGTADIVQQVKNKEFLNMQVMTADPNFKIPKAPKFPKFPDPDLVKLREQQGITKIIKQYRSKL